MYDIRLYTALCTIVAASWVWHSQGNVAPVQPIRYEANISGQADMAARPKETGLANGLHLLVIEDPRTPHVVLQLHIQGAGAYYDPPEAPGLAAFAADVAKRGTMARTFDDMQDDLKAWDAVFNMGSGAGSTVTIAVGATSSRHLPQLLELLSEVMREPAFAEGEIQAVRAAARSEDVTWRTYARLTADAALARALYGRHPAAFVMPSLPMLESLTRERLRSFARERYVPDHAVLAIAGGVTFEDSLKQVEKTLGPWRRSGSALPSAEVREKIASNLQLVGISSADAVVDVGALAVNRTSSDFEPLELLMKALYAGPGNGRLAVALGDSVAEPRSPKIPPIDSNLTPQRFGGFWRVQASIKPEAVQSALTNVLGEIARLRDELLQPDELKAAKDAVVTAYLRSLEDPQRRLSQYLASWIYKLPPDFWDRRPERLAAIKATQLRSVARKYLDPKRLNIIVVGPRERTENQLKPFGRVTISDADGRILSQ